MFWVDPWKEVPGPRSPNYYAAQAGRSQRRRVRPPGELQPEPRLRSLRELVDVTEFAGSPGEVFITEARGNLIDRAANVVHRLGVHRL
jgi:hypothetical protein